MNANVNADPAAISALVDAARACQDRRTAIFLLDAFMQVVAADIRLDALLTEAIDRAVRRLARRTYWTAALKAQGIDEADLLRALHVLAQHSCADDSR